MHRNLCLWCKRQWKFLKGSLILLGCLDLAIERTSWGFEKIKRAFSIRWKCKQLNLAFECPEKANKANGSAVRNSIAKLSKFDWVCHTTYCSIFFPLKWAQECDCTMMLTIFNINVPKHFRFFKSSAGGKNSINSINHSKKEGSL
jgi:hypothetical protein